MGNNRRNGKIDLLKFLFAVVIVIHHGAKYVIDVKDAWFIGGSLAVEFFFIVSGYLLAAGIYRLPERTQSLGRETGRFMLRKLKSFYPEVVLVFVLGFALQLCAGGETFGMLFARSFQELFLLHSTGLGEVVIGSHLWYISSMLLCMLILYPLLRKNPHMMTHVVLPLVAVLILGYFCGNKMHPRDPLKWMGFTYKGNLRALAELSIGASLFPLAQRLKDVKLTKTGSILLTVAEWVCYISVLEYMRLEGASRRDYYYILVFAVAVLLSFSGQGIDANWFQGRIVAFLGKFSLSLYLSHYCWSVRVNHFLPEEFSNTQRLVIYFVVSVVTALLIMGLSSLIRRLGKTLKKPLLVKKEQLTE